MGNREIKFRLWDANKKKMIWGPTGDNPNAGWVVEMAQCGWGNGEIPLMQFTGLKDKNGKEVYEDDLVRSPHHPSLGRVVFSDGRFLSRHADLPEPLSMGEDLFNDIASGDCEVIGNIYENPDLLNIIDLKPNT